MTKAEFRASTEYRELMDRIKGYRTGFRFTVPYAKARAQSKAKENGLKTLLQDAVEKGYLQSVAMDYSMEDLLDGEITAETFERTDKQ